MCDVDENGLETIELTEDIGVTNSGASQNQPKPVAASMMSMMDTDTLPQSSGED